PVDLVPGAAPTPAGAGRGGCDAVRHRGAGRRPRRGYSGRARSGRCCQRRAGQNRQSGDDREQALAAKIVADAQLDNINAGTRAEVIAAKKAALERAQASVVLAQKTYDRVSQLAEHGNAPIARLDQATDTLHESQRAVDQAKSAYEQAVNGYTREEREIAV